MALAEPSHVKCGCESLDRDWLSCGNTKPDYQYLRDLFSCLHESDNSSGVDIERDLLPIFDEPHPKPVKAPKRREQVPVPPTTRK